MYIPSAPYSLSSLLQTECLQAPHHSVHDMIFVPLCYLAQADTVLSMRASERPAGSILFSGYFTDC